MEFLARASSDEAGMDGYSEPAWRPTARRENPETS
jgi:hypothetical protein